MKQTLLEVSRAQLLDKSKNARATKSYGTTRYERRSKQQVKSSVRIFDKLDFNSVFKASLLKFVTPVKGETSEYQVTVLFEKFCEEIQRQMRQYNYELGFTLIYRALISAINRSDVYINCNCPDFKYRLAYHATHGLYNSGRPQMIPANITNPNDDLGAGCKHVLKVLSDLDWVIDLATSINNYIRYMEENFPDKYISIIFPAIYGMRYDTAVRKGIIKEDEDEEEFEEPIEDQEPEEESEVADGA